MLTLIDEHIPKVEGQKMQDVHADRIEALQNIAFLMRVDIENRESLSMYLQYMDRILDGMLDDELAHAS